MDIVVLIVGGLIVFFVVAVVAIVAMKNNGVKTVNPTQHPLSLSTPGRGTQAQDTSTQSTQAPVLPANFEREIERLVSSGQLIAAVKLCRDITGSDLKRAKEMVESRNFSQLSIPGADVANAYSDAAIQQQIQTLFSSGQKIEAIKLYRETYQTDLKEAKEAVERLAK